MFEPREFIDEVWSAIIKLYGEYGASLTWLGMIRYDMENRLAIIRVTNAASDMVRTAIATMTKISDKPASIHVIAVSGTIKALGKRIMQHSDQHANAPFSGLKRSE